MSPSFPFTSFFFPSIDCLHPSPPSAVPGGVGVAHNSPPGQTDWGQNERDELKRPLMSSAPPLSVWHTLSCQGKGPTGQQIWTAGLCPCSPGRWLYGGESSPPEIWPAKEVTDGAFKDSGERGETYYVQTFSFVCFFVVVLIDFFYFIFPINSQLPMLLVFF